MNVCLCLPRYQSPSRENAQLCGSLLARHPSWASSVLEGVPNLDIARACIAQEALAQRADFLVWLDSDIVAPFEHVDTLLELARTRDAVVGALYADRRGSRAVVASGFPPSVAPGEVVAVDSIGFGLIVTPRTAFERIQAICPVRTQRTNYGDVHPWFTSDVLWPELCSDDYAFCRRATTARVPILGVLLRGVMHGAETLLP